LVNAGNFQLGAQESASTTHAIAGDVAESSFGYQDEQKIAGTFFDCSGESLGEAATRHLR